MTILDSLRQKHAKDVLIEECKLGSSWDGARRMDAWVLLKTWSPWTVIGYEIKTDRGDFLRDRKWQAYLPVCHELYFVCPAKLIAPDELPQDVGLLWTTGGTRLTTKRKAVRREPEAEALCMLMSYALMSRSRIVENMWEAVEREEPRERWRRWLDEKNADLELGRLVGRRIRQELDRARCAVRDALAERDRLASVQQKLEALGLADCRSTWDLERRLTAAPALRQIEQLAKSILRLTDVPAVESA